MRHLLKYLFFYFFSGSIYFGLELLYRQYSTLEMFCLAGFCSWFLVLLNNIFTYEMDFLLQIITSATFITFGELIVGLIFNQDYHIWDYRNLPCNLYGQICLEFSLIWCGLCSLFIPLLDYIDWKVFKYRPETPPYYKIFGKKIFQFKKMKERKKGR